VTEVKKYQALTYGEGGKKMNPTKKTGGKEKIFRKSKTKRLGPSESQKCVFGRVEEKKSKRICWQ